MSQADWVAAFAAAQAEFPDIPKSKQVNTGQYSYSYADLPSIVEAVLPILHKHDLTVSQSVTGGSGEVGVVTRIYHKAGWVEEFGPLSLNAGNNPQAAGSAISYARRYALTAALGIAPDEDDDAQAASRRPQREQPSVDPGRWLADAVQVFKEWTEDERRQAYKAVMEDFDALTADNMRQVFEAMAAAYYIEHPPSEDEAPF